MYKYILISMTLLTNTLFSLENSFSLYDFYSNNIQLENSVDSIFNSMNDTLKVGQMIIVSAGKLGKDDKTVFKLANMGYIGGVIYLRGTRVQHRNRTKKINSKNSSLPILYSMDAEPALINRRITNIPKVLHTNKIKSRVVSDSITTIINQHLLGLDIKLNFAPVCDISNTNKVIKKRSYGSNIDTVTHYSQYFIEKSTQQGVATVAKHFPGHGLVKGDSHHSRVFIDGELKEIPVYKSLIADSVISIMIGHIDVINNKKYNTNGKPSSCSRTIITDLLKTELGFKGLIISDALGMGALRKIKNPALEASKAGCDFLCMPEDESKAVRSILKEMSNNKKYKKQVYQSVKKIIRLKLSLQIIDPI